MLASRGVSASNINLLRKWGLYNPYGPIIEMRFVFLNQNLFGYPEPRKPSRLSTSIVTDARPDSEDVRLFKERVRKDIDDGYPLLHL